MSALGRAASCARCCAGLSLILLTGSARGDAIDAELSADLVRSAEERLDAGQEGLALRDYARALRWDPDRREPLRELPRLAVRLGRVATASRYAALAASAGVTDWAEPATIRRLANRAAELDEHANAARLWGLHHELVAGKRERLRAALQAGSSWYVAERPEEASSWFDRVLTSPEGSEFIDALERPVAVWEGIVACNLEADRIGDAERAARRLEQRVGLPGRVEFWRGRIALERGRPAVAYDEARECLVKGDTGPDGAALELLLDALSAMNQLDSAPEALRSLLQQDTANADARLALVDSLRRSERYAEAKDEASRLVESWIASTEQGVDDRLAEAASRLVTAICEEGDADRLWELLARLAERWGALDRVGQTLTAALRRDPMQELAAVWLATRKPESMTPAELATAGRVALASGNEEQAGRYYRRLIELAAEFDAGAESEDSITGAWLRGWVYDLADAGAWAPMLETLEWAEEAVPEVAEGFDSRYSRALALNALGRNDEALAVIREAATEAENDLYYRELESSVLADSERIDEAIELLEGVVSQPTTIEASGAWSSGRTRISLAHHYDRRGAEGDAELGDEQLETVLDFDPQHANANNDLAYRWALRGVHLERAARMARLAVEAAPDSAAYADTLGWVLHLRGRHAEAVAELRRSVGLLRAESTTGEDAVLYEHLAAALEANGEEAAAAAALRRAEQIRESE